MATKEKRVVTGDQYRTVDRRMRDILRQLDQKGGSPLDPECVAQVLQWVCEGMVVNPTYQLMQLCGDPPISGAELLLLTCQKLGMTTLDEKLCRLVEVVGHNEAYEPLLHCFKRIVAEDEIHSFFRKIGFSGNARVFLSWLSLWKPQGTFATPLDSRWSAVGAPCALYYTSDTYARELRVIDLPNLRNDAIFVAFRRWTE
jgi:hypothetical protein